MAIPKEAGRRRDGDPAILDHPLGDLHWWETHGPEIDREIDVWFRPHHGRRPHLLVSDWRFLAFRMGPEFDRWERTVGAPMTLRKLLLKSWPAMGDQDPLPPAPSFLEMHNPVGNFLHPARMYFPPSAWVKSEAVLRQRLAWLQANSYTIELAMLEQTHWGVVPGRNPEWTRPDPATPLVFSGGNLQVYGWTNTLDELLRRIEIARRDYGLEVVVSLWEQERIEFAVESAIRETPRVVAALDGIVTAFRNSWEEDEVLSLADQHRLNNAIGAAAGKPCGPHFAHFKPDHGYWAGSDRANILWHQYDNSLNEAGLAAETRRMIDQNSRVTVVPDEHSPAVRLGSYTHAASRSRGQACRDAGAVGGMNG